MCEACWPTFAGPVPLFRHTLLLGSVCMCEVCMCSMSECGLASLCLSVCLCSLALFPGGWVGVMQITYRTEEASDVVLAIYAVLNALRNVIAP